MRAQKVKSKRMLLDVLSQLAQNWCGYGCLLESTRRVYDRLARELHVLIAPGEALSSDITLLEKQHKEETNRTRRPELKAILATKRNQLKRWDAKSQSERQRIEESRKAAEAEMVRAGDEFHEREQQFNDARKFAVSRTGVGNHEILCAALVGFDRSGLSYQQALLQQRMPDIVSLLNKIPTTDWEAHEWAQPSTIPSEVTSRVTPEHLRQFKAQYLEPQFAVEYAGSEPDEARNGGSQNRAKPTIISLGNGCYEIDDSRPINVTPNEHSVLQAFLKKAAMVEKELDRVSGVDQARLVLRDLKTKYDGAFASAIYLPGGKGKGGYHVSIRASIESSAQ